MTNLVAHPAQDHAAVVDRTTRDPEIIHEVIAPCAHLFIDTRLADKHAYGTARPDGCTQLPRRDRTNTDVDEHPIRRTDHHGEPSRQMHPLCCLCRKWP